jgi:CHAT domain-containing protein
MVVASRWNVDSTATAKFMTIFYHALGAQGNDVAAALRSSMASMASDPQRSHPYYWAAFGQFGGNYKHPQ